MAFIPHIKAIQAFEAAARHQNYAEAAKELFVTPAAIGQHVRHLEAYLGFKLFQRQTHGQNRLIPTAQAESALIDFQRGFAAILAGLDHLRVDETSNQLTITASQAVVSKWLLPLLEDFTTRYPSISIRLDVSDRLVELSAGQADIGIRCGNGQWANVAKQHLFAEKMVVVCAPTLELMAAQPSDLFQCTFLHDTHPSSVMAFPSWQDWFSTQGLALPAEHKSIAINAPLALIEAAARGQGLALVRYQLVKSDLEQGRLRQLCCDHHYPIDWGYYLVWPQTQEERACVATFRSWLLDAIVND